MTARKEQTSQHLETADRKGWYWVGRIVRGGRSPDRIGRGVVETYDSAVIALDFGSFVVKPETEVQRQPWGRAPVVLQVNAKIVVRIGITAVGLYYPPVPGMPNSKEARSCPIADPGDVENGPFV